VTAAADDRSFVVMSYQHGVQRTTWFLLRLTPGAAHPVTLTRLPIKPVAAHVNGLALSPDGRELAVMYRTPTSAVNPCAQSMAARDGTVACGTDGGGEQPGAAACPAASPSFVSYSAVTGKPLSVLGRYQGPCLLGEAEVLWADPTGRYVLGFFFLATKDKKEGGYPFGIAGGGRFTRLPALLAVSGAIIPGAIAF
jgi:hypothetical protein